MTGERKLSELSDTELRYKRKFADLNKAHLAAAIAEREAMNGKAQLAIEARKEDLSMEVIASFVQSPRHKDGELVLKPVTRQAVDLAVAKYEGRIRGPKNPKPKNNGETVKTKINMGAFS